MWEWVTGNGHKRVGAWVKKVLDLWGRGRRERNLAGGGQGASSKVPPPSWLVGWLSFWLKWASLFEQGKRNPGLISPQLSLGGAWGEVRNCCFESLGRSAFCCLGGGDSYLNLQFLIPSLTADFKRFSKWVPGKENFQPFPEVTAV